jgi:hypothetical protein
MQKSSVSFWAKRKIAQAITFWGAQAASAASLFFSATCRKALFNVPLGTDLQRAVIGRQAADHDRLAACAPQSRAA